MLNLGTLPQKTPSDWSENTLKEGVKTKEPKFKVLAKMTGRINSYMECLIEHPDGRREYVSAKELGI